MGVPASLLDRPGPAEEPTPSQPGTTVNISQAERWASVGLGTALLVAGAAPRSWLGLAAVAGGAYLIYRGNSGQCQFYRAIGSPLRPEEAFSTAHQVTVDRDVQQCYRFWQQPENYSKFVRNLVSVQSIGPNRTHWVLRGPGGRRLAFDETLVEDRPNELLRWHSLPGGDLETASEVRFQPAPDGRGTQVSLQVEYRPPYGLLGQTLAQMFHSVTSQAIADDLEQFKRAIETEAAVAPASQPSGVQRLAPEEPHPGHIEPEYAGSRVDEVDEASEESFPGSDSPAWSSATFGRAGETDRS